MTTLNKGVKKAWGGEPKTYKIGQFNPERGNSYFVVLPKSFVHSLGMEKGDMVTFEHFQGGIFVKKVEEKS